MSATTFERDLVNAYTRALREGAMAELPACPACGDPLDLWVRTDGTVERVLHPMPSCPEFIEYMENHD